MAQTQFEIIKHLHSFPVVEGVKYQKEINLVSWYGKEPKYDIRGWSEEQAVESAREEATERGLGFVVN